MLQHSFSLPLLQLSCVVTPCLLKAWRGRHGLGHCLAPGMGRDVCGVPAKGCMWELVPAEFSISVS